MFNRKHSVEVLRDLVVGLLQQPCENTISLEELNGHEPEPTDVKILRPIKIKG